VLQICVGLCIGKFATLLLGAVRLVGNVWRYEKLPIAGDFLSSYTKVEAGYNP